MNRKSRLGCKLLAFLCVAALTVPCTAAAAENGDAAGQTAGDVIQEYQTDKQADSIEAAAEAGIDSAEAAADPDSLEAPAAQNDADPVETVQETGGAAAADEAAVTDVAPETDDAVSEEETAVTEAAPETEYGEEASPAVSVSSAAEPADTTGDTGTEGLDVDPEPQEDPVPADPYVVTKGSNGLTCTYNGKKQVNIKLSVLSKDGKYTIVPPGKAGSVVYAFDAKGNGKKLTGKTVAAVSYQGKKNNYYIVSGKIKTASAPYKVIWNNYLYCVTKAGVAEKYKKNTSKSGTYRYVESTNCYNISYKTGKVASKYTGVYAKKYYKKGKLGKAKAAYYVLYKNYVYKVSKNGAAAKYIKSKKSGSHRMLLSGVCYSVNNKTAKATKYSGVYKNKLYKKGKIATGWQKIGSKKYYATKKGVPVKGKKKISKKWYFFKASGVMATKDTKEKGVTYYINKNQNLEAYKKGSAYYLPNGKKMSVKQRDDYTTLRTARAIVAKITTSKMTKEQKLKKCFDYVMAFPYKRQRMPFPSSDPAWCSLYANDHFIRKAGDCHSDAAAFAYLARAVGYKDVYVCLDTPLADPTHHAWTKVNGKNYDPLFAQSKSYSRYYAASSYELTAIVKTRVGVGFVGDK